MIRGDLRGIFCQKRLKLSFKVDEWKALAEGRHRGA